MSGTALGDFALAVVGVSGFGHLSLLVAIVAVETNAYSDIEDYREPTIANDSITKEADRFSKEGNMIGIITLVENMAQAASDLIRVASVHPPWPGPCPCR